MASVMLLAGILLLAHVRMVHASTYMLVPLPFMSHCLEMAAIGRELQSRGHNVHLLAPDYFAAGKCVKGHADGVQIEKFKVDPDTAKFLDEGLAMATGKMGTDDGGFLHLVKTFRTMIPAICGCFSQARPVLDRFKSRTASFAEANGSTVGGGKGKSEKKVDLVLVDGLAVARCLTLIPAYLNTSFALVASFIEPYDSAMPWPVTSYPFLFSTLPGEMSFVQRLSNTVMFSAIMPVGDDFGPDLAAYDYGAAMKSASLYPENSDYLLDYPKAVYPNFVQVRGLTTGPAKPLPQKLKAWFDGAAKDGVVIVSLGSVLYNTSVELTDKLLAAMAKVKARVVVRLNVENARVKVVDHVLPVDWFPQNDALGHPKTRLFVSHCGKNGFFEGLYHGVPILCTPFNADAFGTGSRVKKFGVGGSVDVKSSSADDIANLVNSLMQDEDVRQRMKKAAMLFHDRPETPAQRAASALEHVIKYGGDHLRPSTWRLGFLQYTGLDVFLALFCIVGLFLLVGFVVFRLCIRFLLSCARGSKQKSE